MTLAEAAPSPLNLASWNLCVLGVAVAGDTMHAEFVPMSQCRHLAIVACVDSLCAIRTKPPDKITKIIFVLHPYSVPLPRVLGGDRHRVPAR